ncbi:MAG: dihydroneopterin aldolase [Verrucomicrobiota bacterium]
MNEIRIDSLRVKTRIGVPDAERATDQELEIDLRIEPDIDFFEMQDDISKTIDYALVCEHIAELAAAKPRKLIETLAAEIAELVRDNFGARFVEVEVRKFILPQTRFVAVRCRR